MYGTQAFYLVFKLLATIYERLVKAKQLVKEKVEEDLKKEETLELVGMAGEDEETQKRLAAFKEDAIRERFSMMVSATVGTLSVAQKVDSSNYEDIARLFMGRQAYLLFHFDKLVTQVSSKVNEANQKYVDFKNDPELEKSRRLLKEPETVQTVPEAEGTQRALIPDPVPGSDAVSNPPISQGHHQSL